MHKSYFFIIQTFYNLLFDNLNPVLIEKWYWSAGISQPYVTHELRDDRSVPRTLKQDWFASELENHLKILLGKLILCGFTQKLLVLTLKDLPTNPKCAVTAD